MCSSGRKTSITTKVTWQNIEIDKSDCHLNSFDHYQAHHWFPRQLQLWLRAFYRLVYCTGRFVGKTFLAVYLPLVTESLTQSPPYKILRHKVILDTSGPWEWPPDRFLILLDLLDFISGESSFPPERTAPLQGRALHGAVGLSPRKLHSSKGEVWRGQPQRDGPLTGWVNIW